MPGYPALVDLTFADSFGFVLRGQNPGDDAGFAVSAAGDVNGDGYADFIVGAPEQGAGGSAYIVFGKASGFTTTFLGSLTPADGFRIDGEGTGDMAGISVSSAGDINNDGYDDLIVGADHLGTNDQGAAYVLFGKASGFANISLATLAPADGFKIQGNGGIGRLGHSVASAGDINNDGYDDIIIGAPDGNARNSGTAYLIFGKASGFGTIDVTALAPTDGFSITGAIAYDRLGMSVSAGDINNDGYDDLILGAPFHDSGGTDAGAVFVLFGKAAGFAPVDLATITPADGFKIQASSAFINAGTAVSTAGDFNGDGYDDLIIGAPKLSRTGNSSTGEAYLVFGKASGFGTIDLAALTPADGFKIINSGQFDFAGAAVSSAGDINNDGYDDLLVGVPGADSDGNDAGEVFVLFGRASGFGPVDLTLLTATEGFRIRGDATGDDAGTGAAAAGDINNDGFDDIIVGSPDALPSHEGAAYIIFGRSTAGTPALDNGATDSRYSATYTEDGAAVAITASDVVVTSGTQINSMTVTGGFMTLDGSPPAGITASGVGTGTITFTGSASNADYASALALVRFSLPGDNPTNFGANPSRIVQISVDAGLGPQLIGVTNVAITGIDDPPVARDDDFGTLENANLTGNVFPNNGHGADSDPDTTGPLTVTAVNGSMANVGVSFLLPSGAILRLNSNGSFTWEHNNAFLSTPAPGSGAVNQPAFDQFNYTLTGGSTATVRLTITGVDSADFLIGPAGPNTLTGGNSSDTYLLDHPDDVVVETVNGGTRDVIYAQTSYKLGPNVYVEVLSASDQSGTAPLELVGNALNQEIYGNAGANFLEGGGGTDYLIGLGGNDTYLVGPGASVVESVGGGSRDVIYTPGDYVMTAGVDVEVLSSSNQSGTNAQTLVGNGIAQEIYGSNGANFIDGGGGADFLSG
ncbi:MAG: hypothetical protein QOH47_2166, partial [Sphingomonadales bacterium]|nr:hypothetical protein [Sphingomonadales bacterium]